jgi:hypothetical protein
VRSSDCSTSPGHPGDLAQAFPTLPHRVQRTPALHALLASPLRGLLAQRLPSLS